MFRVQHHHPDLQGHLTSITQKVPGVTGQPAQPPLTWHIPVTHQKVKSHCSSTVHTLPWILKAHHPSLCAQTRGDMPPLSFLFHYSCKLALHIYRWLKAPFLSPSSGCSRDSSLLQALHINTAIITDFSYSTAQVTFTIRSFSSQPWLLKILNASHTYCVISNMGKNHALELRLIHCNLDLDVR